ncbi:MULTISPECIES: rhodanese-like domain-containing protein [unclassified Enterococcus]|uniref:rhodanese-like domain-containing protein n=1 Tax=unclassified Enterococcus TaxID=2608891 RepID=UPI0013EA59C5|nr:MULTISPECIES: rhodanese-like domain-containing protein [unclassified Enterococcus]
MAKSITVQDFNQLTLGTDAVVLDTRNTLDYTKKHLSHSLSIPAAHLPKQLKNLDPFKHYYILSYTGRRSEILADQLTEQGFHAVYIVGGMEALQGSVA